MYFIAQIHDDSLEDKTMPPKKFYQQIFFKTFSDVMTELQA